MYPKFWVGVCWQTRVAISRLQPPPVVSYGRDGYPTARACFRRRRVGI